MSKTDNMAIKLVEQIEKIISQEINEVHTAIPATIVSYNYSSGRVSVQPCGKLMLTGGKMLDFPIINDVPLYMPSSQSADAIIAVPVCVGDSCLLLFSEQALDTWLGEGESSSDMRFSMSSAIAIPGIMRKATEDVQRATKNKAIIIRAGDKEVSVSKKNISLKGDVIVTGSLTVNGRDI